MNILPRRNNAEQFGEITKKRSGKIYSTRPILAGFVAGLVVLIIIVIVIIVVNQFKTPSETTTDVQSIDKSISKELRAEEFEDIMNEGKEMIATRDQSGAVKYYLGLVNEELSKNETFKAFQIIWIGYDELSNAGMEKEAAKLLTEVDASKFDVSQQYSIYQAIITISENIGDDDLEARYLTLFDEAKKEVEAIEKQINN